MACHCHTWSAGSGMSDMLASHVCVDTLLPHESVGVSGPLVPFAHHPVGRWGWEVPDPAATTRTPRCWPCGHRSDGGDAMHQALAGIGGSQPSRRSGKRSTEQTFGKRGVSDMIPTLRLPSCGVCGR